jgi:hypothetical protein
MQRGLAQSKGLTDQVPVNVLAGLWPAEKMARLMSLILNILSSKLLKNMRRGFGQSKGLIDDAPANVGLPFEFLVRMKHFEAKILIL